ncbi:MULTISPECIES: magnesium transporter [Spongiibacter]|uniref:magnesium transporter n=1 Tax=Spongiibacter TaxID=630749 RepID=UPI0003B5EC0B|nr:MULTISPECIES: magnesium transporter [Spongiibacter]MAY38485.1 magnesium transporter [Spongiibacter sp.]MBI59171.1 magnesium transporter [Spongiibacter sp.]|tara:strand:+ start:24000 stop:25358 length:1359 start_codon:yes stop_codon:yes gene_type:complete
MAQPGEKHLTASRLELLNEALGSGAFLQIRRMLNGLPPVDAAHLIESTPQKVRGVLWQLVDSENEGDILQHLSDEVQSQFLRQMDAEEVAAITEGLEADDIADILQQLPDRVIREVLESMDHQDRLRVEHILSYDEDSAGGLMNTDTITVRPNITLDVALRYLRRHEELPEMTDSLIVVNRNDQFIGILSLRKLLVSDPSVTVREIMDTEVEPIVASMPAREVANLFERRDWVSAPVVDENHYLLGRITIDDVVDVIREESDHSLMSMAGLDEDEDTFASVMSTAPRRAIWLGINLLTAFIASGVINLFEGTIEKVVALAVLMPIVASMGGVAGTQTLTVVIRGMALGHISRNNSRWLINREVLVGLINGLIWAVIVAVAASLWFNDPLIGAIIAAAMVINLITASLAGAVLPLLMKTLKIDPALAGGVVLTTVTDVVGFMSFLGLATYFYA